MYFATIFLSLTFCSAKTFKDLEIEFSRAKSAINSNIDSDLETIAELTAEKDRLSTEVSRVIWIRPVIFIEAACILVWFVQVNVSFVNESTAIDNTDESFSRWSWFAVIAAAATILTGFCRFLVLPTDLVGIYLSCWIVVPLMVAAAGVLSFIIWKKKWLLIISFAGWIFFLKKNFEFVPVDLGEEPLAEGIVGVISLLSGASSMYCLIFLLFKDLPISELEALS